MSRPAAPRPTSLLLAVTLAVAFTPVAARAQDAPAPAAPERLTVDLGSDTGPFHGGASGTLYGLYDARLPFANTVEGIALRTISTKAQDGVQHPGADALDVVRLLTDASGGDTYIYMTDIYREFPYAWKQGDCAQTMDAYVARLRVQMEQIRTLPQRYRDRIVLVPFNEPEGNMFGDGERGCDGISWLKSPRAYFAAWDRVYRLAREMLPGTRIAGPNTSILFDQVYGFMEHAVEADTVPDVVTWHELSNPSAVADSVRRYRGWEDRIFAATPRRGTHLPININEYAFNYHTSVPGQMVQWLAGIEEAKVDADIAYWNVDGNISDSVVQANRANGQWWLLNAYAAMRGGHTLVVTPPHPGESYTLQGVAALDPAQRRMRLLFGGASGPRTVGLTRIPTSFGPRVRVRVREIGWTGQLGDSPPPRAIADLSVPVTGGAVDLAFGSGALPPLREEAAYEVIVSPATDATTRSVDPLVWRADFEAEDARHTGAGYRRRGPEGSPDALGAFFTSGRFAVEGFATDSDVTLDFAVDVPRTGRYDLAILANSFNKDAKVAEQGPTNVFLRVDGGAEQEVFLPLGYKPVVWDHADTHVRLNAGRHVITLSTRGLADGARTRGNAMIDRITLALPAPAATTGYDADTAWLRGAVPARGGAVRLPAGATATFWVYAAKDAPARLTLDRSGGAAAWTLNGTPLAGRDGTTAFLVGGVNKVVVTGGAGGTLLRSLRVDQREGAGCAGQRYEAEDATLSGTARAEPASLASGGKAVFAIGGAPGNDNTLTFAKVHADRAGRYALTIRYSNAEQSPATHYNPDLLARVGRIAVNGAEPLLVTFPNSFHRNNWWEVTVPVTLRAGDNSIRMSGEEQPEFDGRTYASQAHPDLLLRSRFAPNVDRIAINPLEEPTTAR